MSRALEMIDGVLLHDRSGRRLELQPLTAAAKRGHAEG